MFQVLLLFVLGIEIAAGRGDMILSRGLVSASASLALLMAQPVVLHAEVDGEELQQMMRSEAGREYAQVFIDDVWQRWDGGLFCMPDGDRQQMAFGAVESYLDKHPGELYRPRRYLIVQALRTGFPCAAGE
jgi:hypothetical protein